MRILLTGRHGQVGWALERALPALGEIIAVGRASLEIGDFDAVRRVLREAKPEVIVNAAAYTAVDQAEAEPELAMRINGEAPGVLAEEAKRLGALLVHYSTDYVFDGEKRQPYVEDDPPNPLNAYGRSKLEGERNILAAGARNLILRTSWVFSPRGRNFLLTMLNLAKGRTQVKVVSDQVGAPTSAGSLASATVAMVAAVRDGNAHPGTYHVTARGETNWCEFARAIFSVAGVATQVVAIPASDYPAAARRPKYSLLDNSRLHAAFGLALPHWTDEMEHVLRAVQGKAFDGAG